MFDRCVASRLLTLVGRGESLQKWDGRWEERLPLRLPAIEC